MNTSGEAADQVVRMSMEVGEAALKITGTGAKQLAVMLYAILKEQKKTSGRVKLESLVRSGRPLTVFSVRKDDLKTFISEAKRYGILYCAIRNSKSKDGMVDIMVKEEDAPRINRIVERFQFATVTETAKVQTEIEQSKSEKKKDVPEQDVPEKSDEDKLLDELLEKPVQKDEVQKPDSTPAKDTPFFRGGLKSRQSENTSTKPRNAGKAVSKNPSVKEEIREMESARKNEAEKPKRDTLSNDTKPKTQKTARHKQPNNKKRRKPKERE